MSLHLFYTPVEAIEVIIESNLKKVQGEKEKILLTGILGGIFIGVAGMGQLSIIQSSNQMNESLMRFIKHVRLERLTAFAFSKVLGYS